VSICVHFGHQVGTSFRGCHFDCKEKRRLNLKTQEVQVSCRSEDANFEAASLDRSVRILEAEECFVTGSEELLRSAIENVVRNALTYTVTNSQVEVSLCCGNTNGKPYASIVVRDHGPGLPDDELKKIFRPFYRVDGARDRQSGGAGLGLAIQRIVGFHNGTVTAANALGGGLLVEIRLPVETSSET
jgi:two-component system, OmpR family, sensor histidine kinase CpxA